MRLLIGLIAVLLTTAADPAEKASAPRKPAKQVETVANSSNASEIVYITRTGKRYHRPTCRHAAAGRPTTLGEASQRLTACLVCRPPTLAQANASTASSAAPAVSEQRPVSSLVASQCAATTKKGTRCSRKAQAGRAYCWQH